VGSGVLFWSVQRLYLENGNTAKPVESRVEVELEGKQSERVLPGGSVGGGGTESSCEIGASQRGPEPWNTEPEVAKPLNFVTRQPIKTQQTEETSCVL
jgi:hypothetical protein